LATVIPRLVLLDLEPDSVLAPKLATYSKTIGAKFHVQCCENIVPAVIPALTRGDARHAIRNSILIFRNMRVRRLVAGIIAISETVKECFDRRGYEGRTAVIPLAFDPGLFHNDERRRSSVRENMGVTQPLIAFFGRMVPEKGIHILLEALEKMIDLDWRFMCDDVVQSHEEFAASVKERLAKDPLRSRTRLIHPTHDEIAAFMNAADIVVVPSVSTPYFREQFGRVVSESMGSGCCVVVSDSGALPWVLGGSEYGVVFPEGDGEELARVLRQLIASPELREAFGRRAAARAQTEFTISRQADLLEEYWAKAGVVVALPSGASA
jgi:glycosyltransferase involved in cell wall biosynthesis